MTWKAFLIILAAIESGGDPTAIGDKHLKQKAYGLYQIRQPYLTDVNRIAKAEVLERWGRPLVLSDVSGKGSEKIAEWAVKTYLTYYGKHYSKQTGKRPSVQIYSRIHNGGPSGWSRKSTVKYWLKFKGRM